MSFRPQLQANSERVAELYASNVEVVQSLQATLINEILPNMRDELELDEETEKWAKEWLEDTVTMFQISRRQQFTRSFAMEAIRKNLVWRIENIRHLLANHRKPPRTIFCLPNHCRDPFGHPIIVLRVTQGEDTHTDIESPEDFRAILIPTLDRMRVHLRELSGKKDKDVVMQYIVLLDLQGVSIQGISVDLITWTIQEVIPKFPNMLAAVLLVNYSWTHSGAWAIARHLLPASALARVFFPSQNELIEYFGAESVPKEYGGSLPPLDKIPDPLRSPTLVPSEQSYQFEQHPVPPKPPHPSRIPRISHLNPFFGYPTFSQNSTYSSHRTKLHLVRTLAFLFWEKWGRRIKIIVCFLVVLITTRLVKRSYGAKFWRALVNMGLFRELE